MASRLMTYYGAFFSQRYWSPHPCPSFSLSNLGNLDPVDSSSSDSADGGSKGSQFPELVQHLSKGFPYLQDVHLGVTTGICTEAPTA